MLYVGVRPLHVFVFVDAMAIHKRVLLLSACALTFFGKKYAPESPLTQGGFIKSVVVLFAVQYFLRSFYGVVVYPFFLSPLRHLPQPPVCVFRFPCPGHFDYIRQFAHIDRVAILS